MKKTAVIFLLLIVLTLSSGCKQSSAVLNEESSATINSESSSQSVEEPSENAEFTMVCKIKEVHDKMLIVEELDDDDSFENLFEINLSSAEKDVYLYNTDPGEIISVVYRYPIAETYPAKIINLVSVTSVE